MKNIVGSKLKIVALSLLVLAMIILMYNTLSDFKYWIAVIIITVSLGLINYEYFMLYNKTKTNKSDNSNKAI